MGQISSRDAISFRNSSVRNSDSKRIQGLISSRNKGGKNRKLHPRPFRESAWFAFSAEAANAGRSAGGLVTHRLEGLSLLSSESIDFIGHGE